MNMNSKRVSAIIAAFACAIALTACGKATDAPLPAGTPAATAEIPAAVAATPESPASTQPAAAPAALGRNWLSFGAGTVVVDKTSQSRSSDSGARQLIDESGFAWQTGDGSVADQSVTLELPARTTFKTFVVDTAYPTYLDGSSAKDVRIEVSDESATAGFVTVLEATLQDSSSKGGVDGQAFPVTKEVPARWVRYTARGNFGSSRFILTKELYGHGDQDARAPIASVSGTYRMESIGELHLKQDGNSIIGCYAEDEGIMEGTIDGRTMTLTASGKSDREKGAKRSYLAVNVADDGKTLLSTWWGWSPTPVKKSYDRFYVGTRTSDKIGNCPHLKELDGVADVVKDGIEQSLQDNGKAVLNGINFAFDSDVIRPESRPILDKVVAILKDKSDWTLSIDGHTDDIGGQAFNQALSERRAASVAAYLTGAGIAADRLSSQGHGFSKPVAPNNSESERAQNRRVELVRK